MSGVMPLPKPRTSLRIIPNEISLRGASPLRESMEWESDSQNEMPRALRGLSRIVDGGLCHRCGSCVGICPTGVLGLDSREYPIVKNLSACTDCDLCVKVCPGDEFDFFEAHKQVLGVEGHIESTHGSFREGIISYATDSDIRERSTSGGLVTGILLSMLERKEIDGAVVVVSDATDLWKGKAIVARTRDEILSAMKSKYAICPTNSVFSQIREIPGRYVLVGLPCQIHGFVKAAALDERIKERIVLTIGIFCHAAIEHEALRIIWESLGDLRPRVRRFISRIGKHPGTPYVELDDGTLHPVYFGSKKGYRPTSIEVINILYRLFTPERCLTCFDALGDFADISVGDPWMAPPENSVNFYDGWSYALLRTARGQAAHDSAVASKHVHTLHLMEQETRACNIIMSTEKRWRAFRVIETHKRQGKAVPTYAAHGYEFPRHSGSQFLHTELHMLSHIFCFLPRWRASALRFFLGNGGYVLFWLNHKRRALRFFIRDTKARMMRAIFGRR